MMAPAQAALDRRARLLAQRDALEAELRVLDEVTSAPESTVVDADLLLKLYLSLPSAQHVARFVNGQGLRVPGKKGPRELQPHDLYSLVRGEPCVVAPSPNVELHRLALQHLKRRGGWMPDVH